MRQGRGRGLSAEQRTDLWRRWKLGESLHDNLFPYLDARPIAEITAPELLKVLRRIEERGANETTHRANEAADAMVAPGAGTGAGDCADGGLDRDPRFVGRADRCADGAGDALGEGGAEACADAVCAAGRASPGGVKDADLDVGEWRYLVQKTNTPHIVPLSTQAVAVLAELQLLTGDRTYVVPSARNAVTAALHNRGLKDVASGHGFRATARTILDEVLEFPVDYIEHLLAQTLKYPNGRAYNRTKQLAQRKQMMQRWADYLETVRAMR